MAIRPRNKVSASFSMSGMTDIVFLLLLFFMITSTMIHPTALKLLLPRSSNQIAAKAQTTVSIDKNLDYFVGKEKIEFSQIETYLQIEFNDVPEDERTLSIHADRSVPIDEVVRVMNIAVRNRYKVILATSPE